MSGKEKKNHQEEIEKSEETPTTDHTPQTNTEPDFKEKYVRLLAEFSNYQRQKEEETKSIVKFGNSNLLLKILDILDDIEMGLIQENINEETRNILQILQAKMSHLLALEGVAEIELRPGDAYDAAKCEVITTVEDEANKGKISNIARKGYMMGGERVLRTAKVIVGK